MEFKAPNVLKEYAAALNDDELKHLYMRLDQKFHGDLAEALLIIQRHEGMDVWLKSAKSHSDFYNFLDVIVNHLEYEIRRRSR